MDWVMPWRHHRPSVRGSDQELLDWVKWKQEQTLARLKRLEDVIAVSVGDKKGQK
jgi:hypothetical protein